MIPRLELWVGAFQCSVGSKENLRLLEETWYGPNESCEWKEIPQQVDQQVSKHTCKRVSMPLGSFVLKTSLDSTVPTMPCLYPRPQCCVKTDWVISVTRVSVQLSRLFIVTLHLLLVISQGILKTRTQKRLMSRGWSGSYVCEELKSLKSWASLFSP